MPNPTYKVLAKQTFSAVASVSFDNVFNSTYKQYKIVFNAAGATTADHAMRLRAGGVDNSSTNYSRQYIQISSSTVSTGRNTGGTYWDNMAYSGTTKTGILVEIINPYQTAYTSAMTSRIDNALGANISLTHIGFGLTVTTSYDGFTWYPVSSTVSGTITVYGLVY